MGLNVDAISEIVPITFFIEREYGADIYASVNTLKVKRSDDSFCPEYVRRYNQYREHFANSLREKIIMVTDDENVAKKLTFLLAGDDKCQATYDVYEDGSVEQSEYQDETEGVFIAQIDMHEYEYGSKSFPDFSIDVDGAYFYGARNEEDLKKCLGAIVSCDLSCVVIALNEGLWRTKTARRILFDYPFVPFDARGIFANGEDYKRMIQALIEDNKELEQAYQNVYLEEDELSELAASICGNDLTAENLIDIVEFRVREMIMEEYGAGELMALMGESSESKGWRHG